MYAPLEVSSAVLPWASLWNKIKQNQVTLNIFHIMLSLSGQDLYLIPLVSKLQTKQKAKKNLKQNKKPLIFEDT